MQPLLTVTEVAELLSVPVKTMYAWRYHGDGPPAIKVGRHLRYRPDDVEAWLDQQAAEPAPAA